MTRDFVVGLFFLGFLALLGVLSMSTGALRAEQHSYRVTFDRIQGLARGDEVRHRGARIGQVKDVELPTDTGVGVVLSLERPLQLREGARFRVSALGPLGGTCVEYFPGEGAPAGTLELMGSGSEDVLSMLGDMLNENKQSVRKIISDIETIVTNIRNGEGLAGKLIGDSELSRKADEIVKDIREIVARIEQGQGPLGRLINDEEIGEAFDHLPRILDNLDEVTEQLAGTKGPLGVLINDEEAGTALKRIITDIRDKRGLFGRLVSDEQLAQEFNQMVHDIDAAFRDFREGKGLIARLAQDEALAKDFQDTMRNLRTITDKANQGDGTIGKLLNDPALYRDLQSAMISLRDTTEDAREQAPINAFFNAIFSVF